MNLDSCQALANDNASFGRDPFPGVRTPLQIQCRTADKLGEVAFAEQATIVLAMPK